MTARAIEPAHGRPAVRLCRAGLDLGDGHILPLRAGAMHYFRHAPSDWAPGLDALVSVGLRLVDVYVPWGQHESEAGRFDFGENNPRLDVGRFLRMADERGLKVVLRPGPHINAELTYFGLPERIVWNKDCQARTPHNHPVMLPMPPLAFPVPSYASDVFHDETARWYEAMARVLAPLCHPHGPIVLVQVDNEGALYFRDGAYDQDYHKDSIRLFREFVRAKYETPAALAEAWVLSEAWSDNELRDGGALAFSRLLPPQSFEAKTPDDLPRHIDWMEFHEHLLGSAMQRFATCLRRLGFNGVPTMHNFPLGEVATPLNAARMTGAIDLVALDYYHHATPTEHLTILRRTTELSARSEGAGVPAYGAEVGAGFPPFFAPMDEADSIYTLLAALAYGLRGYCLYMAVERDRWVGAPIDPHGHRRPLADTYEALSRALEATHFHELRRRAPVRLVVPRSLRRLARATHAFGPITPAIFNVLGAGFRESCLEDDFGLGTPPTLAGEAYIRAFERALTARGVPFAYAGGENLETSLADAAWIVCVLSGGVKPQVLTRLRVAQATGSVVTVGPSVPDRDGSMKRMRVPHDVSGLELEPLDDATRAYTLVARRMEQLALPTYTVDPGDLFLTVHEDDNGVPRVAFVMNPTPLEAVAKVAIPRAVALVDVLPLRRSSGRPSPRDLRLKRIAGSFEVPIGARTVRMFAIET
jgi:beta-galactosidase